MAPHSDSQSALSQVSRSQGPTQRIVSLLLLCSLLSLGLWIPTEARADDRMATIAKDTLYGGLIGLVLGGTLTLVVEEEDRDDVVRWGVVFGVFGGFFFGVYEASRSDDLLSDFSEPGDPASRPEARRVNWGPLALRMDPLLNGAHHGQGSRLPLTVPVPASAAAPDVRPGNAVRTHGETLGPRAS